MYGKDWLTTGDTGNTGDPQAPPRVYSCGSDEGFVMISADGKIMKQARIGHAQTQSVAKYRPEAPEPAV